LIVKGAAQALDFYKRAFGATEKMRMDGPGGKVMHAEIKIGDSPIMLADEQPEQYRGPQSLGGTPVSLMIYVEDVDTVFPRAVAAGAKVVKPVQDHSMATVRTLTDPFGHQWTIGTQERCFARRNDGPHGPQPGREPIRSGTIDMGGLKKQARPRP
jgi:PhnB protein